MEQLVPLPSIARLSDRVVRVLGQNPGKFTLQGTNTYLVGKSSPRILIDTGEGKEDYLPLLEEALTEVGDVGAQLVSDVVLTHKHADHHGGLPSVLHLLERLWNGTNPGATYIPPRVHKFPLPSSIPDPTLTKMLEALKNSTFIPTPGDNPLHELGDACALSAPGATLKVIHTPGHTVDSICLHLVEEDGIFTADTVLGQGTAVFENLSDYIASLQRLLTTLPTAKKVYPGHGPVVEQGRELIQQYISHRLEREAQVLALLRAPPPQEAPAWTAELVVKQLYAAYPENLWPAAQRGIELHLKKLEADGTIEHHKDEGDTWAIR